MIGRYRNQLAVVGVLVAGVLIWEIAAVTVFAGRHVVPTPYDVVVSMVNDNVYFPDLVATLSIAWRGYLIGNTIALGLASLCLLVPSLESYLLSMGVATYAVPTVAVGPLLITILSSNNVKVAIAVLSVFFVTLVAAVTGLRAASPVSIDMVSAFGGGRWAVMRKVRLRAAVPSLVSGLALAAPAAILGAIIGDYLGGQTGLGVVLLQAEQDLEVSRTWAIALVATLVSGACFALTMLLARIVAGPHATSMDVGSTPSKTDRKPGAWGSLARAGKLILGIVLSLVIWTVLIRILNLNSYYAKTPADVWHYLASDADAAANRDLVLNQLGRTLVDAGIGWVAGTVAAIVAAMAMTLIPVVSAGVYPIVLVLRAVPIVAMTPLIALVFGRGLTGVAVIAGIVTFVPSLVILVNGLRVAPTAALDVVLVIGGSQWESLRKVRLPFAAPAAFGAAKVSMPGAILGAVLAEWLITGKGIGGAMAEDIVVSQYTNLWTVMVVVIVVSLTLYAVVGAAERFVQTKLAIG